MTVKACLHLAAVLGMLVLMLPGPAVGQAVEEEPLRPVRSGSFELDADPRSDRPAPPTTLEALETRFLQAWQHHGARGRTTLEQGDSLIFTQSVEAGVCYAAAAVSLPAANGDGDRVPGTSLRDPTDIDIVVRRDGEIVAQDLNLDSYPIVRWCAALSGVDEISIHAWGGRVEMEYGLFVQRGSRQRAAGDLDELSNRLNRLISASLPRWRPAGPQWRASYDAPGSREFSLEVPATGCVAIAFVAQVSITEINAILWDARGEELSRDFSRNEQAVIMHCGEPGQELRAGVAVRAGRGVVAAQELEPLQMDW